MVNNYFPVSIDGNQRSSMDNGEQLLSSEEDGNQRSNIDNGEQLLSSEDRW